MHTFFNCAYVVLLLLNDALETLEVLRYFLDLFLVKRRRRFQFLFLALDNYSE